MFDLSWWHTIDFISRQNWQTKICHVSWKMGQTRSQKLAHPLSPLHFPIVSDWDYKITACCCWPLQDSQQKALNDQQEQFAEEVGKQIGRLRGEYDAKVLAVGQELNEQLAAAVLEKEVLEARVKALAEQLTLAERALADLEKQHDEQLTVLKQRHKQQLEDLEGRHERRKWRRGVRVRWLSCGNWSISLARWSKKRRHGCVKCRQRTTHSSRSWTPAETPASH